MLGNGKDLIVKIN